LLTESAFSIPDSGFRFPNPESHVCGNGLYRRKNRGEKQVPSIGQNPAPNDSIRFLNRAVIFLQNRFRYQKRCSYPGRGTHCDFGRICGGPLLGRKGAFYRRNFRISFFRNDLRWGFSIVVVKMLLFEKWVAKRVNRWHFPASKKPTPSPTPSNFFDDRTLSRAPQQRHIYARHSAFTARAHRELGATALATRLRCER
jgi:hypothetical protein